MTQRPWTSLIVAALSACAIGACTPPGDAAHEAPIEIARVSTEHQAAFTLELTTLRTEAARVDGASIPTSAQAAARLGRVAKAMAESSDDAVLTAAAAAFEHDCIALAVQLPRIHQRDDVRELMAELLTKADVFEAAWITDHG